MTHNVKILEAQKRVFRLAARDHGLSLKAISLDADIGYSTVQSWASGRAVMSLGAFHDLVGVIPDELLSLLLPTDVRVLHISDEVDHDALYEKARDYQDEWAKARRSDSPAGPDICPIHEEGRLNEKAASLRGV